MPSMDKWKAKQENQPYLAAYNRAHYRRGRRAKLVAKLEELRRSLAAARSPKTRAALRASIIDVEFQIERINRLERLDKFQARRKQGGS